MFHLENREPFYMPRAGREWRLYPVGSRGVIVQKLQQDNFVL